MLFITSRTPEQAAHGEPGRKLTFDVQETNVGRYIYFCQRTKKNEYIEEGSKAFFQTLKDDPANTQLLFYIHGFNNLPEKDIFPNAKRLETRLNSAGFGKLVRVIPIIWPCDDDSIIAFADDYWDDQDASTASGKTFKRLLKKFDAWREELAAKKDPCYRRLNLLAHSMGNNVLQHAINEWAGSSGNVPQLFRNIFMVAADVANHTLEKGELGQHIPASARNVTVYYANDDLAMPASKVANLKNLTTTRRLGMTGPEDLQKVPRNVVEVDCDNFNNSIDKPKGHTYFIEKNKEIVSPCIKHMAKAIKTGRVEHQNRQLELPKPKGL